MHKALPLAKTLMITIGTKYTQRCYSHGQNLFRLD